MRARIALRQDRLFGSASRQALKCWQRHVPFSLIAAMFGWRRCACPSLNTSRCRHVFPLAHFPTGSFWRLLLCGRAHLPRNFHYLTSRLASEPRNYPFIFFVSLVAFFCSAAFRDNSRLFEKPSPSFPPFLARRTVRILCSPPLSFHGPVLSPALTCPLAPVSPRPSPNRSLWKLGSPHQIGAFSPRSLLPSAASCGHFC